MAGEIERYQSREVGIPTTRPLTRDERAVRRQALARQTETEVIARLTRRAAVVGEMLFTHSQGIVARSITRTLAGQDQLSDPRAKALMQKYDALALDQHMKTQLGVQLTAMQRLDGLIEQGFEPAPEPTTWELLFGRD